MAGENLKFSDSLDQWIDIARIKHRGKMNENCQLPTANCQLPTKSGFTLVELSIVIVIIGLLIGGVLVGRSLIESAKINNEVRKISQYSIAIINFQQKFKQYPGDSNLFNSATAPAGNNNKFTGDISGSCPNYVDEAAAAWSHLSQSQMLNERYVWNGSNFCAANYEGLFPYIKFSSAYKAQGFVPDEPKRLYTNPTWTPFAGKRWNYKLENIIATDLYGMLAIEKKIDDGVISTNTGIIETYTFGSEACTAAGIVSEAVWLGSIDEVRCVGNIYFNNPITPN